MLNKRVFNVICIEKDKISTNDDWDIIIPRKKCSSLKVDKIYTYIYDKKDGSAKTLAIHFGMEICKLVDFKIQDRLHIFLSKKNPYIMRIMKSTDNSGYLISKGWKQETTMRIGLKLPDELKNLPSCGSKETDFDFLNDNSIILNFSNFRD